MIAELLLFWEFYMHIIYVLFFYNYGDDYFYYYLKLI